MISTIDDLDIDESPEAQCGLTISERVTCILIAAEHAIEHAKRTPDVASLTSVVKRLLSMLVSAPFRPSHFQERVEAIAKGENRHAVIAGAIAELLAGDVAIVDKDRYYRSRKLIGVFQVTSVMVSSRELMPLTNLYDQMRSNPSVLVKEIVAIADRRLAGESLDAIFNPQPQRPFVPVLDPYVTKQARVERRRQARAVARGRSPRPKKPRAKKPVRDLRFAKAIRNGQLWLDGKRRRIITKDDKPYQFNQRDQGVLLRCQKLLASLHVSVDELTFVPELVKWTNLLHCKSQNEKPHRRDRQKRPDISTNSCDNHSNVLRPA